MTLEREQLEEIGEYLRGTCKSVGDAVQALALDEGLDETQLQVDLLEVDTEICVHCDWWHEPSALQYNESHGGGLCEQCCEEVGVEFE
ncbi:hypothetical protein V0M98_35135 (plasmid) [Pseudomonas silesiensis]|uniref:hypothetical protein n=1 Tax=Pseudomonas silesiensis TaxID=1853130 RepID=UPI0030CD41B7